MYFWCPKIGGEESFELRSDQQQPMAPHPLPMPEYGGYFAPLTQFLPDVGLPISGFHRYGLVDGEVHLNVWFIHLYSFVAN